MSCEAKCKYWKPVLNFISCYLIFHLHANKHLCLLFLNAVLLFWQSVLSYNTTRNWKPSVVVVVVVVVVCYCCKKKKLFGGMEMCIFESMRPVRLHPEKQLPSRGLDPARCSACNVRRCHGSPPLPESHHNIYPWLLIHITAAFIGILISALFTIIMLSYSKKKTKTAWLRWYRYVLLLTVCNFMWLAPPV